VCVYLGFIFFVFFQVSLSHFIFVLLAVIVSSLVFQYLAMRLAEKTISKMTYIVSKWT